MLQEKLDSDLLRFIVERGFKAGDRLPSIEELSSELGVSIGKLREQLEVARSLGLVEVKPRTGIRLAEYDFAPAVQFSLFFALASGRADFEAFGTVRNHLEAAFWHEAAGRLTAADHAQLRDLIAKARAKLNGRPVQIPHAEHRALHLTIFGRLENPFVTGLLAAYWDAYEAVGLSMYSDYAYLQEVWDYHARMVEALAAGDLDRGHTLLVQHTQLLRHRQTGAAAPEGMASIG